jgi:carotenoid 9,10(9',10')-cleavage dioxygenase 1
MVVVRAARLFLCFVLDTVESAVCFVFLGGRRALRQTSCMQGDYLPNRDDIGTHQNLVITRGEIPAELAGAYLRVGPNARFDPHAPVHLFDGDGAVAAFTLQPATHMAVAKATLTWQYVKTEKLLEDIRIGRSRILTLGSLNGRLGLFYLALNWMRCRLGIVDTSKSSSTANTALTVHARRLLALNEVCFSSSCAPLVTLVAVARLFI